MAVMEFHDNFFYFYVIIKICSIKKVGIHVLTYISCRLLEKYVLQKENLLSLDLQLSVNVATESSSESRTSNDLKGAQHPQSVEMPEMVASEARMLSIP